MELIVILCLLSIIFAPSIFTIVYIIKSLISKKLSKKWANIASLYMLILIAINIFIILIFIIESQNSVPDEGGLVAIIFIFIIFIELINLFILRLFYSLYYMHLNKNNSEVDNKKPLKNFIKINLLLCGVIGVIYFIIFIDENKNYLVAKKTQAEIIRVNNIADIPKLDEYKMYYLEVEDTLTNSLVGKKVLIKGFPYITNNKNFKTRTKWSFSTRGDGEEVTYDVYINSDEKFDKNYFTYVYGTIKNVDYIPSDGYANESGIINVTPDKIYYIEEKDYSINLADKYNGNWCFEDMCLELELENSTLKSLALKNEKYKDSYIPFKYYPDNTIYIESYERYSFDKGMITLYEDRIIFEIIESSSDYFKEGMYSLTLK